MNFFSASPGGHQRRRSGRRRFRFLPQTALSWIITLNFAVFACQSIGYLWEQRLVDGRVVEMQFGSLARGDLTESFEWWRLFTYMFVHDASGLMHVGLNMLMVFICGRVVQAALGELALVKIYVFGGLLGGIMQILVFPNPVVGASASAYALLVALGMLIPEQKVFVLLGLVLPVRMRIKYLVIGMVSVTVAFFLIDLIAGTGAEIPMISNIGHMAHLGGALAGFLYCRIHKVGRSLTLVDLRDQRRRTEAGGGPFIPPPGSFSSGIISLDAPQAGEFLMTEVDPILDKIAREGFLSLTDEERAILQRGLRQMSRT